MSGPQPRPVPGRGTEPDEIVARALAVPGAAVAPPEHLAHQPLAALFPGRTPLPPGPRAAAAAVTGRHSWVPVGPRNVAGRVRGLACADPAAADPTTWYAASAGGGVWRSTNGGRRWDPLFHDERSLAVGAIAVAPGNPRRVYAATGEAVPAGLALRGAGVFVTADGGQTWSNHAGGGGANPVHRGGFEAIAVDPAQELHCWAVGTDGAFRTLDGGLSWDRFDAGVHYSDVAFAGTRLYLVRGTSRAGEGAVLRLDAPGAPAAAVAAALAAPDTASIAVPAVAAHLPWPASGKIAVAPSDPTIAYVRWAGEDDRHLGVHRTTTATAVPPRTMAWTRLADHPSFAEEEQGTYDLCIAVDPTNPARVATGAVYLHVSANATAGANAVRWRRVMHWSLHDAGLRGHHADQHQLVIAGNPPQLWVAHDGGVARSTDWATGAAVDHGERFRPDPVRPLPPGAVTWQRRDTGISGAQPYDLGQHPLLPPVLACGLQDNGVYLRTGGPSWRPVFGADGGFCAFDPDDPYRLLISYYDGLLALQFPALRDTHFPDGVRDPGSASLRTLQHEAGAARAPFLVEDGTPFVPETARHPRRTGRALHARRGRLYGLRGGTGEQLAVEPLGRSVRLVFRADPAVAGPTDITIGPTDGARRLGLLPGRHVRADRTGVVRGSRLPAPYRTVEGDRLDLLVNGTAVTVTFTAAAGIDPAAVTVADVLRLVAAAAAAAAVGRQVQARPSVWHTPSAVALVSRGAGVGEQLVLGGDALDPLPDGLPRLGLHRGAYRGDDGRGASVLLGHPGTTDPEQLASRDFTGPVRTLTVAVGAGPARAVRIEPPAFPDPAAVTAGQLAAALRTALAAEITAGQVDVHAVAQHVAVRWVADPGRHPVLTGTAAVRLGAPPAGALGAVLAADPLVAAHQGRHRRQWASVDLRPDPPAGPPLQLVISDGVTATAPLPITAADVADLRSVTTEELHRLVRRHLDAHAVAAGAPLGVRAELVVVPFEGAVSELAWSPAHDDHAWAGTPDGGVFRTVDDGRTWTDVADPAMRSGDRVVEAIAPHPTDPDVAYVGLAGEPGPATGDAFVFRTADGGRTWRPVGHRVVGGVAQGVVAGGRPVGVNAIELDPADPRVVFAATDAGVFRSPDEGATWERRDHGLPHAIVVDLAAEPTTRVLRAALWTRGVHELRLDAGAPHDARLLVRATELDDGNRPTRAAPALGAAAPEPVAARSPDIVLLRHRRGIGADADLDGVTVDLDLPRDDVVVPGSAAEVLVQVHNLGSRPVPSGVPAPPAERVRVVLLWAPLPGAADPAGGAPPLPGEVWARLAAGPLAGAVGAWTVLGDGTVPHAIRPGDTGVRSFPVAWPALPGVPAVALLALVTAPADVLTGGPLAVAELLATERRAAVRALPVRAEADDRTLLLSSTDGTDFVVEQPAPPAGTGVADRLGLGPADLGVPGRARLAAPGPGPDRNLAAGPPGPALLLRSAAPLVGDLVLLPVAEDAVADPADAGVADLATVINRAAEAAGLPVEAFVPDVGVTIACSGTAQVRVTGGAAAARLGLVPAALAGFVQTPPTPAWFNLAGAAALNLEVAVPGGPVAVAVDLAARHFPDPTVADPAIIARLVGERLRDARLDGLVDCYAFGGLGVRARGQATLTAASVPAGLLGLPAGPDRVLVGVPPGVVDLTAAPTPRLRIEVTRRALVRFDADPAAIGDLTRATHADIRRAITDACDLAGMPVRAEIPHVELRVGASPVDGGATRPVLGGAASAELAVAPAGLAPPDRARLFALRAALGTDRLTAGAANALYLRVRNTGTVTCRTARLRLFEIDLRADPVTVAPVAAAAAVLDPAAVHVAELGWAPPGPARTALLLAVADDDRPGRRIDVPATFPSRADLTAFVAARPAAALRSIAVAP